MKALKVLAAAAVGALALGVAGAASAATFVFDFNVFDASKNWVGPSLGTLTVQDTAAGQVRVTSNLNSGVFFMTSKGGPAGNPKYSDDLAFKLTGVTGLAFDLDPTTVPANNPITISGNVTERGDIGGSYGQGWGSGGWTDAVQSHDNDTSGSPSIFSSLDFFLTGTGLSTSSFDFQSLSPNGTSLHVFFLADLSQTLTSGAQTGPVGATLKSITRSCEETNSCPCTELCGPPGVPEPATWAMMIIGFGAAGSAIRRRRAVTAA